MSKNWQNSFNGKLFEKIFLETVKRIDSDKIYSPCKAGGRFVEIFPDGVVRGCEVEKLEDGESFQNLCLTCLYLLQDACLCPDKVELTLASLILLYITLT